MSTRMENRVTLGREGAFVRERASGPQDSTAYLSGDWQPPEDQMGMLDTQKAKWRAQQLGALVSLTGKLAGVLGIEIEEPELVKRSARVAWLLETRNTLNQRLAEAHNGIREVTRQRKVDAKAKLLEAVNNGGKLPKLGADSIVEHMAAIKETTTLRAAADDLIIEESRDWLRTLHNAGFLSQVEQAIETWATTDLSGDDITQGQIRDHQAIWAQARPHLVFLWTEYQGWLNDGVTDQEKAWVRKQVRDFTDLGRTTLPTIGELRERTWSSHPAPVRLHAGEDYQAQVEEERRKAELESADAARARLQKEALTEDEKASHEVAQPQTGKTERTPEEQARIDSFIGGRMAAVEEQTTTTKEVDKDG